MSTKRYKMVKIYNEILEALCKYQYSFLSGEWNKFIFARTHDGDRVVVRITDNCDKIIIELDNKHEKETN